MKLKRLFNCIRKSVLLISSVSGKFEQLEILKSKYDAHFDYLSKGAIIRSRASWYEKGEKNANYFLSLESHQKAENCVRKVFTKKGTLSSDPKIIMNELEDFTLVCTVVNVI